MCVCVCVFVCVNICVHESNKNMHYKDLVCSQLTLTDVVDPPDYEDFVLQNQCLVERDPFRDLLLYPEDDIEVQKVPKPCRTISLLIPEPG